ncbi:MAG: hypothetical protein JWN41_1272, partial [Thermoleophilia bacterium]|nr:hypothetical protein [Thermoleophilia bacterium]
CGAGMRHGIFEGYVERHGLSSADSSAFVIMCGNVGQRLARYDCAHGLGHAATRENRLEIEPSMRFCQSMPYPDGDDCASAVLMTTAEGVLLDGGPMSKLGSARELVAYCTSMPTDARTPCYRWIPLTLAFSKRLTRRDVVAACSSATPASIERSTCFVGVGRQANGDDPRSCIGMPDDAARAACSYGLLVGWAINRVKLPAAAAGKHCARQHVGLARNACYLALGRVSMAFREHAKGLDGTAICKRGLAAVRPTGMVAALAWCVRGTTLVPAPLDYSSAEQAALRSVTAADQ